MRKNLIAARKKAGFTQSKIAAQISIGARQYKALEAGTSDGSIKVWVKLKNLLNLSIDHLVEKEETANQPDGNPAEKQ